MFSSLTSRYSINPSCKKLSNVRTPALKEQKIKSVLKLQLLIKETRHKLDLPTTPSYDVLWSSKCPCQQWQVDDKLDLHQKQRKHSTENMFPLKVSCAVMILYTGKTLQKQDDAEGSNKRQNWLKAVQLWFYILEKHCRNKMMQREATKDIIATRSVRKVT